MAVADYVAKLPYVDGDRMAAAGGSYGGYMIDWMLGHTARFKALVSHAGVYDLRSESGETEELWFPTVGVRRHAVGQPGDLRSWSPSLFVKEFNAHAGHPRRTGFSRARRSGPAAVHRAANAESAVEADLFPDEGHWILKPQNSLLWYKTFHRLDRFLDKKVKPTLALIVLLPLLVAVPLLLMSTGRRRSPWIRR